MNKLQILVVEDDAPVRNLITTTLKAHDYKYMVALAVYNRALSDVEIEEVRAFMKTLEVA